MMAMNMLNNQIYSIEQVTSQYLNQNKKKKEISNLSNVSFQDVLKNKTADELEVTFSKHANERLESRDIHLTEEQVNRLNYGVAKARSKNIQESLVMMDNLTFIVNVNNNMVITAMNQDSADEQVYTNIDGAVII